MRERKVDGRCRGAKRCGAALHTLDRDGRGGGLKNSGGMSAGCECGGWAAAVFTGSSTLVHAAARLLEAHRGRNNVRLKQHVGHRTRAAAGVIL